jgi:hypothetical protein
MSPHTRGFFKLRCEKGEAEKNQVDEKAYDVTGGIAWERGEEHQREGYHQRHKEIADGKQLVALHNKQQAEQLGEHRAPGRGKAVNQVYVIPRCNQAEDIKPLADIDIPPAGDGVGKNITQQHEYQEKDFKTCGLKDEKSGVDGERAKGEIG